MILPLGDSPNLPKTPWVTWGLIAVNVAVFLALFPLSFQPVNPNNPEVWEYLQVLAEEGRVPPGARIAVSRADLVTFEYGIKPGSFNLVDAFTSMFLHGGWLHLAGNMLFLWIFGDNVEHRLGRWKFLLAYLGTGFAAALGDTALRWGSEIPSVGASGAISGVLGLYFAWFPRNRVRVWVLLFPFFMNVLELPARLVLGFYLVIDNLLPLLFAGAAGGVSYGAHIGGFIAGWALARVAGQSGRERRQRPRVRPAATPGADLAGEFRAALAAGRLDEAVELLFDRSHGLTRSALSPEDKVALGEELERAGVPRPALAAYQRALADHPRGPHRSRAHLGAARALLALEAPTAAYQHLYEVLEEEPTPEEAAAARALLERLRAAVRNLPSRWP